MPNKKISELVDGSPIQSSDLLIIARAAQNYSIPYSAFVPGGVGADTQIIYNDGGALGADASLTFDLATETLTHSGATSLNVFEGRVGIGGSPDTVVWPLGPGGTTVDFGSALTTNRLYDISGAIIEGVMIYDTYDVPVGTPSILAFDCAPASISSENIDQFMSVVGGTWNLGTGDINLAAGFVFGVYNNSSGGNIGQALGARAEVGVFGGTTGTITDAFAFYGGVFNDAADPNLITGDVTGLFIYTSANVCAGTGYGIDISDHSATGVAGGGYNIYSRGTTSLNVFEGRVGIGASPDAADWPIGAGSPTDYDSSLLINRLHTLGGTWVEGATFYDGFNPGSDSANLVGLDLSPVVLAASTHAITSFTALSGGAYNYGSGAISDMYGFQFYGSERGSSNIGTLWGGFFGCYHRGSGDITMMKAAYIECGLVDNTGSVGTAVGAEIQVWNTTGSQSLLTGAVYGLNVVGYAATCDGASYGIHIGDFTGVGAGSNYNLFSAGSTSLNVFEGNVTAAVFETSTALVTATDGAGTATFTVNMVASTGGPTTGSQNGWLKMKDDGGNDIWVPVWK